MIVTRNEHTTIHNVLRKFNGGHMSCKDMAIFQLGLLKDIDYGKIPYKIAQKRNEKEQPTLF